MGTKGPAKPGVVRISGSFIAGKDTLWMVSLSLRYQVSSFKIQPYQSLLPSCCALSFFGPNLIFTPECKHTFKDHLVVQTLHCIQCLNYTMICSRHCEAPCSCYKLIATENHNPSASPPRNVSLFWGQSRTCSSTIHCIDSKCWCVDLTHPVEMNDPENE